MCVELVWRLVHWCSLPSWPRVHQQSRPRQIRCELLTNPHIHIQIYDVHALTHTQYICPDYFPIVFPDLPQPPTHRQAIINAFVYVHQTLHQANNRLVKRGGRTMAITPRHYLDFINHYVSASTVKLVRSV